LLVRLGSKSCCGWSAIGRDCRGSAPLISAGRAAGRGTVSKRHCSNSFFYIYIFYICGDPKMGYNSSQEKNHVFSMWDKKTF
jgi:hypothetical protein